MIKEYKLINGNGISVVIISYGGIIKEINTPSSNGKFENIVLGYKYDNEYLNDKYYMGAMLERAPTWEMSEEFAEEYEKIQKLRRHVYSDTHWNFISLR
tara:strand:- start:1970 stop:2266 length:297 start_codon:yes stop_codon:yes gene_type:complete